jgi:hypothetical protein
MRVQEGYAVNFRKYARKPFQLLGLKSPREDLSLIWKNMQGKPFWWSNFPLILNFDTCNFCGQEHTKIGPCEWCYPQNEIIRGRMKYQEMPMDQIVWILENINKYGAEMREATKKNMGLGSWDPFYDGDPLANQRLPEILKLGKQIAPGINTELFTCGTLTENAWMLCSRDVDRLHVTLSAHNTELYRKVHRGNQFENVLRTLRYITDHRKPNQKLILNHVTTQTNLPFLGEWHRLMRSEFPDWQLAIVPLIVSKDNVYANAALGTLSLQDQECAIRKVDPKASVVAHESIGLRQPCQLWSNMTILVDGTIMECCNWYNPARHNYGNIVDYIANGYDLHDAWVMRLANKHNNEVCRSCAMKRSDAKQIFNKIKVEVSISV